MMKEPRYIKDGSEPRKRVLLLSIFAATIFFLLLTRLWYLQIMQADRMQVLSETNRLRLVPVTASRGAILDRNGKVLVNNTPSFSVAVVPQDVKDRNALINSLASLLNSDPAELQARWEKGKGRGKYFPIIIASGITRDHVEYLEENRLRLPGIDIAMKPIRQYPNGLLAAHLLGHLGEISEQEMEKEKYSQYRPGDYVGKNGIERSFEEILHGEDGGRQIEVDARGRYLRTITERPPVIGNSVMLTIDQDIQAAAEKAFGEKAGAAVAINVNTGEVLAFASTPSFDPAQFAGRMSPEQWKEYLEDKRLPLQNKALKGQYPPGSTYKIITALAGLEEGLIDEHTSVTCNGSYRLGNRTFRCWERKGHGTVNLKKALQMSCDVYFYQLGERLGVDKIAEYARKFGLGKPLGIEMENEKAGLIPDAAWKLERYGQKWYRGETLPVAIGQGYTLMTPIQLASMIASVANGGTIYRPHLVKKIMDRDGKTLKEFKPGVIGKVSLQERNLQAVREGLLAVVNEPRGTGGAARLSQVAVAGKTGTSQVVKLRDTKGGIPYQFRDHALFVAYAPHDRPEIAVAVVVEHGEHGGSAAAPIASAVLRAYFEGTGVIKKPVPKPEIPAADDAEEKAAVPEETPATEGVR